MATYVKYDIFAGGDLPGKVHDLLGVTPGTDCDNLRLALSNTAADVGVTIAVLASVTQIANGNGYATGGLPASGGFNSGARAAGVFTLTGTNQVWTSSGAGMAAFRYVIAYNDTPTSPADPLINSWDYGSALTLAVGETFTCKFNNGASSGTHFTLS